MRKFTDLTEAKGQIVFAFGRFNPPTTGHEKLISKVAQVSGSSPYRIYPSFSQNPKKDPLPHTLKVAYMRKMFPKHARSIVADKDAKTAINVAVKLYDEGFRDLVMVAGSDRVKEFSSLLKTYNGFEGKRHGFYKFDSIDVVSAGERDPDAEGVEGMSASKMRAAAVEGDFDSFQQGLPKGFRDAKKLYNDVRKYMGIREERHMGEMDEQEMIRDAYLTGKIWNVGDVVEAKGITGKVIRKGTNYIAFHDEEGKVHKAWLHEVKFEDLPSDAKTKLYKLYSKGMDLLAGSPAFKKNKKEIEALRKKYKLDERELTDKELKRREEIAKKLPDDEFKQRYGDDWMSVKMATATKMAKAEEIEESPLTGVLRKVNQMTHPKQYDAIVKAYVKSRKNEPKKTTSFAIDKIVRQYSGIDVRSVIDYINKLIKKGVLPKDLAASYHSEEVVKEWYESETIRESYQEKHGDDWWWKLNEVHDRMLEKLGICCEDCISEQEMKCPPATKDLALNTKNRDATTKKYNYGPLNVDEPGDYWEKIAKHWKTSVEAAKKSLCANCVAFDISPRMKDCLPGDTFDDDGELGYCWMHHFKCHSARACHTWAKGGPISKDSESHEWQERAFGKEKETKSETVSFTNFRKFNKWDEISEGAEYDGRPVKLNNPTKGDRKKYKVYVKNDKGNVVKVEFGDPNMEIKRDDPARRRSFRARHNCENPGPKWKARYWSCKFWSAKSVTDLMKG